MSYSLMSKPWRHALLAVLLFAAAPAWAGDDPIYTGFFSNTAAGGYDVVAYFTDGKATRGSKRYTYEWRGAEWRFSSEEHRDRFAASPDAYAPRYGGYCAWAVAQGYTAAGDPTVWQIVDGRLYLNYDEDIGRKWRQDIPGNIRKADANWPAVLGGDRT
jgi:YHS domain-containing protein